MSTTEARNVKSRSRLKKFYVCKKTTEYFPEPAKFYHLMVLDNQKQKLFPEKEVWDRLLHLFGIIRMASTPFLLHVKWMSQLKPLNIFAQLTPPSTPKHKFTMCQNSPH